MQNLEIKTIEHKGIKVAVKINYDKGVVSLVEKGNFQDKHYVFASRGLEYMQGWLNVLDALKFAVTEAKKNLEKDLAEKTKFKEEEFQEFQKVAKQLGIKVK